MKRRIIKIEEDKCTGCGACIPDCPEGALQVIDGKARLISDLFCDGLGACIKNCPMDAMHIEEREAEPYDEAKVMANIVKAGENTVIAHLKHLKHHGEDNLLSQAVAYLKDNGHAVPDFEDKLPCGCPGTMARDLRKPAAPAQQSAPVGVPAAPQQSLLKNWPIQLKLVNPHAGYFKEADIVIAADCTAFSYPNFQQKFLKNKILLMLCPKLDSDIQSYIDKLALMFESQNIKSVTIVHMEVPCCGGVEVIVTEALKKAGKVIPLKDYTISIDGNLI